MVLYFSFVFSYPIPVPNEWYTVNDKTEET